MKKAIFFDFDGTIVDCQKFQIARLKSVFMHFGVDTKGIDFLKLIGPPLHNTFSKYMGVEKAQEVLEYYNASFNPNKIIGIKLFEGIKRMLADLNKKGYEVCLTSLQFDGVVRAELKHLKIEDMFSNIFCDDEKRAYQTKVDLIADVLDYGGYNPQDVVVVGDTENDVIGGTKNSLFTIGVLWGYGNIDKNAVDEVVKTPEQLVEVIENLDKNQLVKTID
ncbi:MAG: HAD hydrolase-like protein [Clostridia bacterium]|nr:HAD hydrolase-like protein [Clostridia bacterium]